MESRRRTVYVVGTESSGKTDLIRQLRVMSTGKLRAQPGTVFPTVGQEIAQVNAPYRSQGAASSDDAGAVEIRELGGSVSASWVSAIENRLKSDGGTAGARPDHYALLFVVDATAPHMIPAAVAAFHHLTEPPSGVCSGWPTLMVVQKSAMAHTMGKEEVWILFAGGEPETEAARIVAVDTWTGKGLGAVLDWVFPPSK